MTECGQNFKKNHPLLLTGAPIPIPNPAISVTRVGEISPFLPKFKLNWQHFEGLFSIWHNLESTLAPFECFKAIVSGEQPYNEKINLTSGHTACHGHHNVFKTQLNAHSLNSTINEIIGVLGIFIFYFAILLFFQSLAVIVLGIQLIFSWKSYGNGNASPLARKLLFFTVPIHFSNLLTVRYLLE